MLTQQQQNEKHDRSALEAELTAAGAIINQRGQVKCPFHEDNNPSGSIYQGEDGVYRYKCFSTSCPLNEPGDIFDIRARRTGQPIGEVLHIEDYRQSSKPKEKPLPLEELIKKIPNVESVFRYTNPDTNKIDLVVIRHIVDGKKSFKQAHPVGDLFTWGKPEGLWPLYNRARLRLCKVVVVVEGEKAVHALHDIGITATTSPGGAGKAAHADWSPLAGKTAVLWPDNDPQDKNGHRTGIEHMKQVADILQAIEPPVNVQWIDPDNLNIPDKGDAVEFIESIPGDQNKKRLATQLLIETAEKISASTNFFKRIDAIASGQYKNIEFPWPILTNLTRALLPGTVTLICGSPGATKSFFLDAMLIHFHENGIKYCAYKLEEDLPFHLNRIFAMKSGCSLYLDTNWMKLYADEVKSAAGRLRPFLDDIGKRITCAPAEGISLEEVTKWVEIKAREGFRVIAIDPITAANVKGQQWEADQQFVMRAKGVCRDYGVSLLLITHPKQRKIVGDAEMNDMAGGACYQRFSQCIIWIDNHYEEKSVQIVKDREEFSCFINRTMSLKKTRNGIGAGAKIGFVFDNNRLSFEEKGIIKGKNRTAPTEQPDDKYVPF